MLKCLREVNLEMHGSSARIRFFFGLLTLILVFSAPEFLQAQDNYEIQVYPSETIAPKTLLTELHSNYTVEGSTTTQYGMLPTQGQEHETIELTEGITNWSEVGFYIFTEEGNGNGVQWVGDHIRPRVRAPLSWNLPVGLSFSNEIGYARAAYANPTWSWQVNPIVDKSMGKWYWSVNGIMNWGIHPVSLPPGSTPQEIQYYYRYISPHGMTFGPAATVTYQPNKYYNIGLEYYSYYGEFGHFVPLHYQQQQFFPVINLFVSPKWEINIGAGWGATASTDHLIVKGILGHYFDWGSWRRHRTAPQPN
jgi:hypothetical protein